MEGKKGFTLVELLAVIVILGIVVGIGIPTVTAFQKRALKQRLAGFFKIVDEAADAYVEQYHADFEPTKDCFEIGYKELVNQGLLIETDITCLSEAYSGVEGKIIATRVNGGNTFTYSHYLTCYDKETNKEIVKSNQIPEGCVGVRGGFSLDVKAKHIKSDGREEDYVCANPDNGCWVSGGIKYVLSSTSPYYYPIKEFQYKETGDFRWKSIEGDNQTFTTDSSINMDIKFRAVDTGNNISSENGYHYIRIDNVKPRADFAVTSGIRGNNNWFKSDISVRIIPDHNYSPSRVASYKYCITTGESCEPTIAVNEGKDIDVTLSDNHSMVCAKLVSGSGVTSDVLCSEHYKIDKTPPVIYVDGKTSNFTQEGYTGEPMVSAEDNIPITPIITKTGTVNTNVSGTYVVTYIATDDAGNSTTLNATYIIKRICRLVLKSHWDYKEYEPDGSPSTNRCTYRVNGIAFATEEDCEGRWKYTLDNRFGDCSGITIRNYYDGHDEGTSGRPNMCYIYINGNKANRDYINCEGYTLEKTIEN